MAAYPLGSVEALVSTSLVTESTREALWQRRARNEAVANRAVLPSFLNEAELRTLTAVCARLLPPDSPLEAAAAARLISHALAAEPGDGWRYDVLPPDGAAYRHGLAWLEDQARQRGLEPGSFAKLEAVEQDQVLQQLAKEDPASEERAAWHGKRFYEDLLATITELYASDPRVQERMRYTGFADAAGWKRIALGERENWEEDRSLDQLPAPVPRREAPTPHMRRYREDETVDAVVVGTGAGGGPLLARLAAAGLKIVALEAGRMWDPAREFATDEVAQHPIFWLDERLSAGQDPIGFGANNSGVGVGGTTIHFTAYTPRPHPDDFRLRTDFGVGRDWPITHTDLEPYLDELETFLGISGPTPYPWGPPRRGGYPLAALPLNGAAQLMERACAKLGIRTSPAPNAALSGRYYQPGLGWRPACTNRGFCQAGCSVGAKASVDVTFIPAAVAAGAEVRTGAFVTHFERDAAGRIKAVVYQQEGRECRQPCRNVFLCGGAIETPRLLLRNGLANGSGQVGRNFMAHTGIQLWGRFEELVNPWKGIPGGLISEDTHRPKAADFAGGYLLQSIGVMPVTYAMQRARSKHALTGAALGEHLREYNHVAGINILGECLPSEQNFLELSDEKDGRGMPEPRIYFTAGENEKRLTRHAEKTMRAIWSEAGGRDLWEFERYAHTIGTCRMGGSPEDSVVDADGRVWDVPGLYICDNSVFPSALAVNPALTIMAVSLRTADRFLKSV